MTGKKAVKGGKKRSRMEKNVKKWMKMVIYCRILHSNFALGIGTCTGN